MTRVHRFFTAAGVLVATLVLLLASTAATPSAQAATPTKESAAVTESTTINALALTSTLEDEVEKYKSQRDSWKQKAKKFKNQRDKWKKRAKNQKKWKQNQKKWKNKWKKKAKFHKKWKFFHKKWKKVWKKRAKKWKKIAKSRDHGSSSGGKVWPNNGVITSNFGPRWGRMHNGTDIDDTYNKKVRVAKSGRVSFSGWAGGYGRLIIVNHGGGLQTYYAHLSKSRVYAGQKVSAGQNIGRIGTTGNSTGTHLHFGVKKNGRFINPRSWYR